MYIQFGSELESLNEDILFGQKDHMPPQDPLGLQKVVFSMYPSRFLQEFFLLYFNIIGAPWKPLIISCDALSPEEHAQAGPLGCMKSLQVPLGCMKSLQVPLGSASIPTLYEERGQRKRLLTDHICRQAGYNRNYFSTNEVSFID